MASRNGFPPDYDRNYQDQGYGSHANYHPNPAAVQRQTLNTQERSQPEHYHASLPHQGSTINGYIDSPTPTQFPYQDIGQGNDYALRSRNSGFHQTTNTVPRYNPTVSSSEGHWPPPSNVTGTQGYSPAKGNLTSNFRRRDPEFFFNGQVFLALWSEPSGPLPSGGSIPGITPATYGGEFIHTQIRRFVVVARKRKHALCVPISTYSGKATTKEGIDRDAHAVIYTSHDPPPLLPNERRLSKRAIKVTAQELELTPESRVNFEKIYTVEYNIKVALVGHVASSSHLAQLRAYAKEALV